MLLLNKTLLGLAKGLWGWIFLIAGLKVAALVGTAAFAQIISGFLEDLTSPQMTAAAAGQAVLSALLTALLVLSLAAESGAGFIAFSPLAQGLLTGKYANGIPADSRADRIDGSLRNNLLTPQNLQAVSALAQIAAARGQDLAQMALQWLFKDQRVSSVLIGARTIAQLDDNLQALNGPEFTPAELLEIERILNARK